MYDALLFGSAQTRYPLVLGRIISVAQRVLIISVDRLSPVWTAGIHTTFMSVNVNI